MGKHFGRFSLPFLLLEGSVADFSGSFSYFSRAQLSKGPKGRDFILVVIMCLDLKRIQFFIASSKSKQLIPNPIIHLGFLSRVLYYLQ